MKDNYISQDTLQKRMTIRELVKKLLPYAAKHKWMGIYVVICIFGVAIAGRVMPQLIGLAVDKGIANKDVKFVMQIGLWYLFAECVRSYLSFAHNYYFQKLGNRILFYLREDLLRHMQHLPASFFDRTPSGRIVTRLTNDVSGLQELFTEGIVSIIAQALSMIAMLVAMSLISIKLTLLTIILTPIFLFTAIRLSKKIRLTLDDMKKKLAQINSFVAENLSGIRVVQLYNRTERNKNRFHSLSEEYKNIQLSSVKNYALFWPNMNGFAAITLLSALFWGSRMQASHEIQLGAFIAFLLHIQDFVNPLSEILEKYQQFQNSLTSADRVFQLMNEVEEKSHVSEKPELQIGGEITINNLSFQYRDDLPMVLKNIHLHIQKGESVAIVGRTGSGKSTLIALLQALYPITYGEVFVDGQSLASFHSKDVRRNIGLIAQDNFLFRGTIADNISLRDPSISRATLENACNQIGLTHLLRGLTNGLDSSVEERGANLSAGERQLVSFARILVFNPKILILDEATANIDSASEKIIQDATKKITKGRTSIIIAHRLSTIRDCDKIVYLENGEIKEVGSHSKLMLQNGHYANLVNSHSKELVQ